MNKTKIIVSVEPFVNEFYGIVSQTEGYPKTEAHDDVFPKETAKKVAKQVKKELQKSNPDKKVILKLNQEYDEHTSNNR